MNGLCLEVSSDGFLVINTNACLLEDRHLGGIGFCWGTFGDKLSKAYSRDCVFQSVIEGEALAMLEALVSAVEVCYDLILIKSNCKKLIDILNSGYNGAYNSFSSVSRGPDSLKGLPDFQFETIPDGLPSSDTDATQDIPALCQSTSTTCLVPFRNLLFKLNAADNIPPITCIVSDSALTFKALRP
ncbi:hypothetical protein NE237_017653 [Protea cynaroides]|uniref:Uncharacterized protein n=1 Tax=Protea cynaroides TaxID=273540 RepID=A0A9Q0QNF4_9MAGN|nr:hypothetical protein NE237_017653 [Protea cynaroides]